MVFFSIDCYAIELQTIRLLFVEFVSFDLIGRRLPFCFFLCVSLAFVIHIMCAHEYNKYVVDLDWVQVDLFMGFQLGTICATSYYKMFILYSDCDQCATYVICNTFNMQEYQCFTIFALDPSIWRGNGR